MNDYKVILDGADSKRDAGKYDAAIKLYSDYLRSCPKVARAYAQRGYCWYYLDDYEKAIRDFDHTISLKSDVPTTYYFRGRCKEHKEDWEGALSDFLESARLKPDEQDVFLRIAEVSEELGRLEEATDAYNKALEFEATAEIYVGLGMIYQFRKQMDKAADYFTKALELEPNHSRAKNILEEL